MTARKRKGLEGAMDAAIQADQAEQEMLRRIRRESRVSGQLAEVTAANRILTREIEVMSQRLELVLNLQDQPPPVTVVDTPNPKAHSAAFVLLCSDWHLAERVDKASTSGRNEYTPTIARKRVHKLIEGARWMIEAWRSGRGGYGWDIDTAVVWLGGDLMTGFIHDDLRESNFMTPTQEALFVHEMCALVLDSIAAHPGIKQMIVPTSWGNHGRDTPERRIATAWKRSYEWLVYQQLALQYAKHSKIHINVGQDEISRLSVMGRKVRFNHGDQFGFAGGVGGITIPGRKWLARLDKTEPADITCIGHWHQYLDLGDLVVNGSLIGWNAFGQRVAPYSPASQVCFLIDRQYGKRMSTEIIV